MKILLAFVGSLFVLEMAKAPVQAETRLWGQLAMTKVDEGRGGVEDGGIVGHMAAVSFHRSGNLLTAFKASVPIRCVSVDNIVTYHDYMVSGRTVPNFTVSNSRVSARRFTQRQGDLLLDDVHVEVSGRFSSSTKASFVVIVATNHNALGQSECIGSMSMTRVVRGAVVR